MPELNVLNDDLIRTNPFKAKIATCSRLIVNNIPISYEQKWDELLKILSVFGPIKELHKIMDTDNKFKGQCYLTYESEELTK